MAKGSPPPFAKKGAKPNPFAGKGKAPPFGKKAAAPAGPPMPFKKGGKV